MQESHVQLTGHLCADPVLRVVGGGTPVANFRIGVTPRWRDRESGTWRDGSSTFYNVSCWRRLAENVTATLHKGDRVVVIGRLRDRAWVNASGEERVSHEVDADLVGPDLNRHTATVRKPLRPSDGGPDAAAARPGEAVAQPVGTSPGVAA
ncbi:MAG TPA: single-stranded DNA-binding protein [Mycobacteriales bacterium]|jgi:single-strand DNA-binding protein|nr:single-stranded DNA-binding protein [Mycobacteriales bacterium]